MSKILSCSAVLGLLVASSSSVFAGGHGSGASTFTPAYASRNPGSSTLTPVPGGSQTARSRLAPAGRLHAGGPNAMAT